MNQNLLEIKQSVVNLHNKVLDLSEALWKVNAQLDNLILAQGSPEMDWGAPHQVSEPIEVSSTTPESESLPQQLAKPRQGRPRKAQISQESPSSPDLPNWMQRHPQAQEKLPESPGLSQNKPETIPSPPVPPKQSLVERLLGKDADKKAQERAAKMAALKKELDELSSTQAK